MKEAELVSTIALSLVPDLGSQRIKLLIDHFGSAVNVLSQQENDLLAIKGVGKKLANSILLGKTFIDNAKKVLDNNERLGVQTIPFDSENYPKRLKESHDSPLLLFYKGNTELLNHTKIIAVVGTRKPSKYGIENTREIISELQSHGCLIISGLAYGIDIAAHKAALEFGLPTIGVMASGIDHIYPAQHKQIAQEMTDAGGLLTEKPLGVMPESRFFPARNRIVAGMSDATLVIEAAKSGGALITANLAHSYHKDVFALPGNVGSITSEGCNNLIKENKAQLITSAKDIEYHLNWEQQASEHNPIRKQVNYDSLNDIEKTIVTCLKDSSLAIDQLSWKSSIPVNQLSGILLNLEFEGIINQLPGKIFKLN